MNSSPSMVQDLKMINNEPEGSCHPPVEITTTGSSELANASDMIVSDDVHVQLYQEVCSSRDLLPILEEVALNIEALSSQTQELADKFGKYKYDVEETTKLLSMSKDVIGHLDEEGCHILLRLIKRIVPSIRSRNSAPLGEVQRWPSRVYLRPKESSHSTNSIKEALSNNWYDHLYMEMTYLTFNYFQVLLDEHRQLEGLIAKGAESAHKLGSLKSFLEKSLNLMTLRRADVARADKKACCRLVKMIKLFIICKLIKGYANEGGKYVWPLQSLLAISEVLQQMNWKSRSDHVEPESSNYESPHQDTRALSCDWHEEAYKELLSMRILYSSQLDDAYISIYPRRLCKMLCAANTKFLEKSLEFLTTSIADMVFLSKEKCYYQMDLIKFFVVLISDTISANRNPLPPQVFGILPSKLEILEIESNSFICRVPLESWPNWRNLVYEELRGIRKKFSYAFDEAYFKECLETEIPNPANKFFLEDSMDFLKCFRATLALESKEDCCHMLKGIRGFLNFPTEFGSAGEHATFVKSLSDSTNDGSLPYWRDEAFKEIQSKQMKFHYKVEVACTKVCGLARQIPELGRDVEEVGVCISLVRRFFKMSRSEMALLSKKDYDETVVLMNKNLSRLGEILTSLQVSTGRRIGFPCDVNGMKLKQREEGIWKCCSCGECIV